MAGAWLAQTNKGQLQMPQKTIVDQLLLPVT